MSSDVYLLDSNIPGIASYPGHNLHQSVISWLKQINESRLYISSVSVGESKFGLNLNPLPQNIQDDIQRVRDAYQILPIDHHTADEYAIIRAKLFNKYAPKDHRNKLKTRYVEDLCENTTGKELGIQENDLWIVSVAVQHHMKLVTTDKKGGMKKIVGIANYTNRTRFLS